MLHANTYGVSHSRGAAEMVTVCPVYRGFAVCVVGKRVLHVVLLL